MAKSAEYMRRYRASKSSAMSAGGNDIIRDGFGNEADLSTNAWWRSLASGIPESKRKDLYYHSGMQESTIAKMSDMEQYEYAKYDAVTINEDLPKITGVSQKQIDYAESIRRRAINDVVQDTVKKAETALRRESIETGKSIRAVKDSAFKKAGIRSFSDAILTLLNRNKLFNKLKQQTSARDIIDGNLR